MTRNIGFPFGADNVPTAPAVDVAGILAGRLLGDLRRIARRHLSRERRDDFEPSSLVNEVYLRLVRHRGLDGVSDAEFLALASVCMGRVLIDDARRRRSRKRSNGVLVDLAAVDLPVAADIEDSLPVRQALGRLAARHPRRALIVRLRFFADLSLAEIGACTGLSLATVKRELHASLAALRCVLQG